MALPACDKVCRPAVLPVRPLDLGAVLEAQLRHREVVILAREVQRCTVSLGSALKEQRRQVGALGRDGEGRVADQRQVDVGAAV